MAEPDVIERMAKAYVTAKGEVVGKRMMPPPPEQRMLAAVRELIAFAREADTPNGDIVADWLAGWVRG